jgi:hypothetical protein
MTAWIARHFYTILWFTLLAAGPLFFLILVSMGVLK